MFKFFFLVLFLFQMNHQLLAQSGTEKTVNIRIQQAPLFALSFIEETELINLEMMFRPTQFINLGIIGASYREKQDNYDFQAYDLGLRIDFVFSTKGGFDDAFYLSNGILTGKWESEETVVDTGSLCELRYKAEGTNLVAFGAFGHQWFWSNGYNLNIGVGLVKARTLDVTTDRQYTCDTNIAFEKDHGVFEKPWVDLGLGYAF